MRHLRTRGGLAVLIGAALAVVVFWIRTGIEESVSHQNVTTQRDPVSRRQVAWVGALLLATIAAMIAGFTELPFAATAQYGSALLLVTAYVALVAPLVSRHPKQTLAIIGLTALMSILLHGLTVTPAMRWLDRRQGRDPDMSD